MSILLDTQTGNHDLSTIAKVLDYTMAAAGDVRVVLRVGTSAKPCVALAGIWKLWLVVGGLDVLNYSVEPFPQEILAFASSAKLFFSKTCELPAGAVVEVYLTSPNAGDTSVAVTAEIWHVSGSLPAAVPNAVGGLPVLDADSRTPGELEILAIKGDGWSTETLKAIKDAVDALVTPAEVNITQRNVTIKDGE